MHFEIGEWSVFFTKSRKNAYNGLDYKTNNIHQLHSDVIYNIAYDTKIVLIFKTN